jgi:sugar phosphate permease
MSPAQAGVMASLFDAGGVIGGVAAGFITDRAAGGKLITVAASMAMLGTFSLAGWAMLVMQPASSLSHPVMMHGIAMMIAGFLVAGPDGIFGGVSVVVDSVHTLYVCIYIYI